VEKKRKTVLDPSISGQTRQKYPPNQAEEWVIRNRRHGICVQETFFQLPDSGRSPGPGLRCQFQQFATEGNQGYLRVGVLVVDHDVLAVKVHLPLAQSVPLARPLFSATIATVAISAKCNSGE
jgi:hypothetical protein